MPKHRRTAEAPMHHQPSEADVLRRGLVVGIFTAPAGDDGAIDLNSSMLRRLPLHLLCHAIVHFGWVTAVNNPAMSIDVAMAIEPVGHYVVRVRTESECRIILHRILPEWITYRLFAGMGGLQREGRGTRHDQGDA